VLLITCVTLPLYSSPQFTAGAEADGVSAETQRISEIQERDAAEYLPRCLGHSMVTQDSRWLDSINPSL
jgi:hypothetical protein